MGLYGIAASRCHFAVQKALAAYLKSEQLLPSPQSIVMSFKYLGFSMSYSLAVGKMCCLTLQHY